MAVLLLSHDTHDKKGVREVGINTDNQFKYISPDKLQEMLPQGVVEAIEACVQKRKSAFLHKAVYHAGSIDRLPEATEEYTQKQAREREQKEKWDAAEQSLLKLFAKENTERKYHIYTETCYPDSKEPHLSRINEGDIVGILPKDAKEKFLADCRNEKKISSKSNVHAVPDVGNFNDSVARYRAAVQRSLDAIESEQHGEELPHVRSKKGVYYSKDLGNGRELYDGKLVVPTVQIDYFKDRAFTVEYQGDVVLDGQCVAGCALVAPPDAAGLARLKYAEFEKNEEKKRINEFIPMKVRFRFRKDTTEEDLYFKDPKGNEFVKIDDEVMRASYLHVGFPDLKNGRDSKILSLEELKKIAEKYGGKNNVLDLTHLPVIHFWGGRKTDPWDQMTGFLEQNSDFKGAFLLKKLYDNENSALVLHDLESLDPRKRVPGGKPERKLVNYRWNRKTGAYVADYATVLHGSTKKIHSSEIEIDPGPELIAEALVMTGTGANFPHPLRDAMNLLIGDLRVLEYRRTLNRENVRDVEKMVCEKLAKKLADAGVKRVSDIPGGFALTAGDAAPDLEAKRDELGVFDIPGLGKKTVDYHGMYIGSQEVPRIKLSFEDFAKITDWPFTNVAIEISGINRMSDWNKHDLEELLFKGGDGRWEKVKALFAKIWVEDTCQKLEYDYKGDARDAKPTTLTNPITREKIIFYPEIDTRRVIRKHGTDYEKFVRWNTK